MVAEPFTLTITYLKFIHGRCADAECPVCRWWTPKGGANAKSMAWNKKRVTSWLKDRLTLVATRSKPDSPWWLVEEDKETCKEILKSLR